MKRKIALALAAVMTIVSAVPMNLFAASRATVTIKANSNYDAWDGYGMIAPGGNQTLSANTTVSAALQKLFNNNNLNKTSLVNSGRGNSLIVRFDDNTTEGYFQIQLDGADFAYAYVPNNPDGSGGVYENDANQYETTFGEWFTRGDYINRGAHKPSKVSTPLFGLDLLALANQDATINALATAGAPLSSALGTVIMNAAGVMKPGVQATDALSTLSGATPLATDFDEAKEKIATRLSLDGTVAAAFGITAAKKSGSTTLTTDPIVNNNQADILAITPAQMKEYILRAMSLGTAIKDTDSVSDLAVRVGKALSNAAGGYLQAINFSDGVDAAEQLRIEYQTALADILGYAAFNDAMSRRLNINNNNLLTYRDEAITTAQQTYGATSASPVEYELTFDNNNKNMVQVHYKGLVTPFDFLVIPLAYNNKTNATISAKIISAGGYGNVSNETVTVAEQGGTGVTVTPGAVATGNYRIYLNDIKFEEKTIGTIDNGQVTFRVKLPGDGSKYYFPAAYNKLPVDGGSISVTSYIGITGEAKVTKVKVDENLGTITLDISDMIKSVGTLGTLVVKGLVVAPINPEDAPYDGEVKLEILPDEYRNDSDLSKPFQNTVNLPARLHEDHYWNSILVAKRAIWEVGVTSEDNKIIYAGREDQYIGKVIINEGTENSWWSDKETTFTLTNADGEAVEGAKISHVKIWASNMTPGYDGKGVNATDNISNVIWSKDLSSVTFADFVTNKGKTGRMTVEFKVSMDPNFPEADGTDLYVTVNKGRELFAQSYVGEVNTVKLGTVKPTTLIEVGETKVQIGYQSLSVANITLTETAKGAWNTGNVQLSIGEYGTGEVSPYMYFGSVAKGNVKVSNSDKTPLTISNVKSGTKAGSPLSFSIDRKSDYIGASKKSEPAVVELKDIVLNISREVPEGSFDLIVGGSALVNNYRTDVADLKGDYFEAAGYVAEGAIQVTTVGSNKPFTKRVDVYYAEGAPAEGGSKVVVDGVETDMEFGAYLDTEVNRVMVPVRFISYVLGVEKENTFWDAKNHTFSIFTPERTVVFTQNSNILTVNGLTSTMMNADGTEIVPIIREDNSTLYLPFAFVGQAFGIEVNSDNQADGFVSYNYDTTTDVATAE